MAPKADIMEITKLQTCI